MNIEDKYLIFLGCAIPYRVSAYEIAARNVLHKLGIEVVEMPEFNCCGLPIDAVSHEMMLTLATQNLALAEQQQLNVITLCPGCSGTLRKVNAMLKERRTLRDAVNAKLNEVKLEFRGSIEVKHFVHFLVEDLGWQKVQRSVVKPLVSFKVAEHNGCHVLRPKAFTGFDDPEAPQMLKSLIEVTGATCLDYEDESECCGAPSVGINDKIPLQLTRDKLNHIKCVGAQALITICPFCHMMYESYQSRIERMFNEAYNIPVLHYPQLLGLAMGLSPKELALNELRVDVSRISRLLH